MKNQINDLTYKTSKFISIDARKQAENTLKSYKVVNSTY